MRTLSGIFMPPNQAALNGRAEIEAWGRAFPPMRDLVLDATEIDGRGDLAYVRGRYSLRDIYNSDLPASAPGS